MHYLYVYLTKEPLKLFGTSLFIEVGIGTSPFLINIINVCGDIIQGLGFLILPPNIIVGILIILQNLILEPLLKYVGPS